MAGQARKVRPLTVVLLLFNVLMAVWLIAGMVDVADNCEGEVGSALDACQTGTALGAGIGVAFVLFVWVAGDVILGVIWLVTRRSSTDRACPVCGTSVPVGQVVCGSCGYDYRTAQQGPVPPKPAIWPPPEASYGKRRGK